MITYLITMWKIKLTRRLPDILTFIFAFIFNFTFLFSWIILICNFFTTLFSLRTENENFSIYRFWYWYKSFWLPWKLYYYEPRSYLIVIIWSYWWWCNTCATIIWWRWWMWQVRLICFSFPSTITLPIK